MLYFGACLWLTGWSFTVGYCVETKGTNGFLASLFLLFVWPPILGCELRENTNRTRHQLWMIFNATERDRQ